MGDLVWNLFMGRERGYSQNVGVLIVLVLTVELSNPKSTRATDWQIYATCIICVCSQNCGLLSTHNFLIIHMNECTCTEFLWHFFSGFKPDAKIMGPEPCQNQPDARNTSPIPVWFWHIMACSYLLNFGHHCLVYISSAAADGLLLLLLLLLWSSSLSSSLLLLCIISMHHICSISNCCYMRCA